MKWHVPFKFVIVSFLTHLCRCCSLSSGNNDEMGNNKNCKSLSRNVLYYSGQYQCQCCCRILAVKGLELIVAVENVTRKQKHLGRGMTFGRALYLKLQHARKWSAYYHGWCGLPPLSGFLCCETFKSIIVFLPVLALNRAAWSVCFGRLTARTLVKSGVQYGLVFICCSQLGGHLAVDGEEKKRRWDVCSKS